MPFRSSACSLRKICTSELAANGLAGTNSIDRPPPVTVVVPAFTTPFSDTTSAPGTVAASSDSLTNSTTLVSRRTPLAPFPGRCVTTLGRPPSKLGAVRKWLRNTAREFPDRSVTLLVTITVTSAFAGSVDGSSVTVRLSAEREMPMPSSRPLANSAMVSLFTVVALSDSEKVKTTTALGPTPVAPSLGVTIKTVGAVTSVTAAVTKLLEKELVPLPARSLTPPKLTVGRTRTFPGNGFSGVNVTTAPFAA